MIILVFVVAGILDCHAIMRAAAAERSARWIADGAANRPSPATLVQQSPAPTMDRGNDLSFFFKSEYSKQTISSYVDQV